MIDWQSINIFSGNQRIGPLLASVNHFKYFNVASLEKDRGFENPEGMVEGYGRVGVRVQMLLPPTNPYPSRGSRGSRGYRRGR
jgi:hypothetical protein